jgi:hypothetical protein
MKMKRFVAVAGILFFLGLVVFYAPCHSYALNPQPEPPMKSGIAAYKHTGTITKIAGNNITLMDDTGKERTIESNLKSLKVGDKVTVNNGKVIGSGNNSSSVEQYKDGEDGVMRTRPGNHKPGGNSPEQPLYKDGEDGVNRANPKK